MNPRNIIAGVILFIILALIGYGYFEHNRYVVTKLEFDNFIAKAQILAAEQLAYNRNKELQYAERLKTAEFARDASIRRLREYTERPREPILSGSPQTAGADTICFTTERLDRGFRELEGIIIAGQEALVDRNLLLDSWPK